MNEYLQLLVYVIIGLTGGAWHYVKKRYVDNTTTLGFIPYLQTDLSFTLRAVTAILTVEYGLSELNTAHVLHLADIIGAITAGYMADSHLNKCDVSFNTNT